MGNPFDALRPALAHIQECASVLPATGQAMEDLMRPDHAEVIDKLRSGGDEALDTLIEMPSRTAYVQVGDLHRTVDHPLRYFLDGSARTYFLGDAVEGSRRTPIHVAQIGAAAVHRESNGRVRVARSVHRTILMLDKKAVSFGDRVEALATSAGPSFGFHDTMESDGETEKTAGKEPRSRAAHKAHHLMAEEEERLGRELVRRAEDWLVLDGSLGKDLHSWRSVPSFIGLTKSFSREPLFQLPGSGRKVVNLYGLLSDLPFGSRTCVFSARAGKVGIAYVRLREQKHLDYPLMGVVKVEFPNPSGEAIDSGLANRICAALVAERQVTPHGRDIRWHAHIYAIYLAEQAVKNGFVSPEVLKAGIRWPLQSSGITH